MVRKIRVARPPIAVLTLSPTFLRPQMVIYGSFYDYPRYYDVAYGATTEAEGAFYYQIIGERLKSFRTLLDLGCGSGRITAELARMGIRCVGVDNNPTSIGYFDGKARRESLDMMGVLGDILEPDVEGAFDAAICTGDTVKYIITPRDLINHMKRVSALLKPEGLYAIDTSLVGPPGKYAGGTGRWTVVDGEVTVNGSFVAHAVDWAARTERIRHELHVTDGSEEYILTEEGDVHAFTFGDYEATIEDSGVFGIECCYSDGYDPTNLITPDIETKDLVILLRKT
jgi:SAM-dependent methyltransferase